MCVVLAWVGFFLRYAALSMVAVGVCAIVIGVRHSARVMLRTATVFAVLALVAPAAWMFSNRVVDGTVMGLRPSSNDTLGFAAFRVALTVGEWVVPVGLSDLVRASLGATVLVVMAALIGWLSWPTASGRSPGGDTPSLLPTLLFGGCSVAYVVAAQVATAIDPINSRLLSPAYVPLVVTTIVVLDRAAGSTPQGIRRLAGGVLVVFVVAHGAVFVRDTIRFARVGQVFSSDSWRDSDAIIAASSLSPSDTVYTNNAFALYARTGRQPIHRSPLRTRYRSSDVVPVPPAFLRDAECGSAYLLWFDEGPYYSRPLDELAEYVSLETIHDVSDGAVYRLGPLGSPRCDGDDPGH